MIRSVLLLLVLWPQLLPAGFCVCRLEARSLPAPPRARPQDAPRCSCCQHQSDSLAAAEPVIPTQADPVPSPALPHAPCCPAHPAWEITRFVEPIPPAPAPEGTLVLWGDPDAPVLPFATARRVPACAAGPPDPVPLYLLLRNLRC